MPSGHPQHASACSAGLRCQPVSYPASLETPARKPFADPGILSERRASHHELGSRRAHSQAARADDADQEQEAQDGGEDEADQAEDAHAEELEAPFDEDAEHRGDV